MRNVRVGGVEPSGPGLVSGEGVRLALAPAGVGSRVIAAVLDALAQAALLFVLALLDVWLAGGADIAAFRALLVAEIVLVLAGYPTVFEWLSRGRTLGKLTMGLRVVRDDGGPIGFRHALVRGLAGFVLEKPGLVFPLTTIAGVVIMSSSAREKRMGDMLAGTVVLNERSAPQNLAPLPHWVPPHLQPWALALDLHRLDDGLALSVRQFVSRAHQMSWTAQQTLGDDLRNRVLAVTAPPPPPHTPTAAVLLTVLAERRRRTVVPIPPTWQPPGQQPPGQQPPGQQPAAPQPGRPQASPDRFQPGPSGPFAPPG
ncbi:MAG: hypothetical protein QOH89_1514 [Pseudonocardiales bacterium]|nr:hypothetical protein [Pseudonocardiales bacterium]